MTGFWGEEQLSKKTNVGVEICALTDLLIGGGANNRVGVTGQPEKIIKESPPPKFLKTIA